MPATEPKMKQVQAPPKSVIRQTLRQRYPLRLRKVLKKNLWSIIALVLAWIAGSYFILTYSDFNLSEHGSFFTLGHKIWFGWVALLIGLFLWKTGYEFLYYKTYFYDIDDKNVIIRKGVVARTEVTLPFSKITDVFVDQDVLDVFFGLCDLHISTPTVESGAFAHIDGLDRKSAAALKAIILEKIHT